MSNILDELRDPEECSHAKYGNCQTHACLTKIIGAKAFPLYQFVGCMRYRAAAEVERLTKANSNLVSQAEESAFNAGEITDWRTERIAEMGYEAARLRARVAHMQFYLQWIYNPAGNDICTPKEIAEMGLKEPDRLRPSPGAVPSGEAVL